MESKLRSLLKALSWRLLASTITGVLVYCFTGMGRLSLAIGACDSVIKILVYYFHERAWMLISFGRQDNPLAQFHVSKPLAAEDAQVIRQKLNELGYLRD